MVASEHIDQLQRISDRMQSINKQASERLTASSNAPDLMATAYSALSGDVSGGDGMSALRAALRADGVPDEQIDTIDALYVRCLLDPSL